MALRALTVIIRPYGPYIQGIHGNTGNTREYTEYPGIREYTEYPGIREYTEYTEYTGTRVPAKAGFLAKSRLLWPEKPLFLALTGQKKLDQVVLDSPDLLRSRIR